MFAIFSSLGERAGKGGGYSAAVRPRARASRGKHRPFVRRARAPLLEEGTLGAYVSAFWAVDVLDGSRASLASAGEARAGGDVAGNVARGGGEASPE